MFGIDTLAVNAESEAKNTTPGSAEVVLVLDYSGSMNQQQKYQRMASAATDMLDAFENVDGDVDFDVGLVPFSAMVRTSMSSAYVTQSSGSSTWTGCTQDRRYPHNNGVATPSSNANTKWGYIDNGNGGENSGQYNCQGYANKNLTVLNLTEDLDEVRQQLDLMRPLGNTNIALGAEFGWNLLDPALPYASGRAYADQTNKKFLVLLTDGVQTSRGWGQGNTRTVGNAQTNLLGLCTGMRNAGITVFTIAYDVDDSAVTDMLEACAPGRYFEPGIGGNDLGEVFSEITTLITNDVVRLTR